MPSQGVFTSRQLLLKELFVGTLIYAVVLGFFDDYTSIVYAASFSTIFLAAFLLQILTMLVFTLKSKIVGWLKERKEYYYRLLLFFSVWLVMFLSKFVFMWSVDVAFGENIAINGFFGILYLVVTVTVIHKLGDKVFKDLANAN